MVGRGGGWGSRGGRRWCLAAASRHALAMLQPESRPAASRRSHGGRRAAAVSCCGWGRAAAGLKLAGAWAMETSSGGRGERGGGGGRVGNWIGMEDFLRIEMGQPRNNSLELGAHLGQQRGRFRFGAPKAFARARSSGLCAGKALKSAPDGRHRRERLFSTVQRQRRECFCVSDRERAAAGSAPSRRDKTHLEWCILTD